MGDDWEIWRVVSYVDDDDNWHVLAEKPISPPMDKEIAQHWIDGHVHIYWHGILPDNLDYELRPA